MKEYLELKEEVYQKLKEELLEELNERIFNGILSKNNNFIDNLSEKFSLKILEKTNKKLKSFKEKYLKNLKGSMEQDVKYWVGIGRIDNLVNKSIQSKVIDSLRTQDLNNIIWKKIEKLSHNKINIHIKKQFEDIRDNAFDLYIKSKINYEIKESIKKLNPYSESNVHEEYLKIARAVKIEILEELRCDLSNIKIK